jgi:hypothetical protein
VVAGTALEDEGGKRVGRAAGPLGGRRMWQGGGGGDHGGERLERHGERLERRGVPDSTSSPEWEVRRSPRRGAAVG